MTDRPGGGEELRELAEMLKRTVHLARAYSRDTGSIFEDAMTAADRMADRALSRSMTGPSLSDELVERATQQYVAGRGGHDSDCCVQRQGCGCNCRVAEWIDAFPAGFRAALSASGLLEREERTE